METLKHLIKCMCDNYEVIKNMKFINDYEVIKKVLLKMPLKLYVTNKDNVCLCILFPTANNLNYLKYSKLDITYKNPQIISHTKKNRLK